jgi:hypothetical protein
LLEKNREQYAEEIFVGKFPKTPLQALLLLFHLRLICSQERRDESSFCFDLERSD